jgi:hypothetical protein
VQEATSLFANLESTLEKLVAPAFYCQKAYDPAIADRSSGIVPSLRWTEKFDSSAKVVSCYVNEVFLAVTRDPIPADSTSLS